MIDIKTLTAAGYKLFGLPPTTLVYAKGMKKWSQALGKIKTDEQLKFVIVAADKTFRDNFAFSLFQRNPGCVVEGQPHPMRSAGRILADLASSGFDAAWSDVGDTTLILAARRGAQPKEVDPAVLVDNPTAMALAVLGTQLGLSAPDYLEVEVDGARAGWDGHEFFGDEQIAEAARRAVTFYDWVEIRGVPIQAGTDTVGRLVALHAFNPGHTLVIEGPQILAPEEDDDGVLADQMSNGR